MFAAGIAVQLERIRPLDDVLRSAAAVDPKVAALRDDPSSGSGGRDDRDRRLDRRSRAAA